MLDAAGGYLSQRGVEAPRLSVEWMLARLLQISRIQVYMSHDRPLAAEELQQLRAWVARRGQGEPLAYILGDQDFCGLDLQVTPAVLIPRPETEQLVDHLAGQLPEGALGVDLGTGSGAIALALLQRRPDLAMWASDLSPQALAVARGNAERLGLSARLRLVEGAWWAAVPAGQDFDFVCSNPPYVDPELPELLADDVRRFEPELALFTPPGDPGAPYREICAGLAAHLRPGGWLALETGVGADQAALAALRACAVLDEGSVCLVEDAAELPRYLYARRPA